MQGSESCLLTSAGSHTLLHPPVVFPSHSSGWNSFSTWRWAQQGPSHQGGRKPETFKCHRLCLLRHHPLLCGTLPPSLHGEQVPFQRCFPGSPVWFCLQSFLFFSSGEQNNPVHGYIFFFNPTNAFARVFKELTLHRFTKLWEKKPIKTEEALVVL